MPNSHPHAARFILVFFLSLVVLGTQCSESLAQRRGRRTLRTRRNAATAPRPATSPTRRAEPRILNDQEARIVNGDPTSAYAAVGIVGDLQSQFCSGTLISPNHVLTAAHCVVNLDDDEGSFEVGGSVYVSSAIYVHPDYRRRTLSNDIAIMVLAEPVLNVVPAQIYRDTPLVGDELTIVGFGGTGGVEGGDGSFGVKRAGTTVIQEIEPTRVIWYFDEEDEANTAPGDSGGPGFLNLAGEEWIVCLTSGGTVSGGAFGDRAFNTRVDAYQDWIDGLVDTEEPDEEEPVEEEPVDEDPVEEDPVDEQPDEEDPSDDTGDDPADDGTTDEQPEDDSNDDQNADSDTDCQEPASFWRPGRNPLWNLIAGWLGSLFRFGWPFSLPWHWFS